LERSEKEKLLADLRQKAGELEMQALRSQMNPHFIFNSLNSINQFILQNDKAQASEYLTKFSRLVRLILQNSQASLIPLESELEALQLYLELEALRFNDHFDFTISVEEDLDVGILKVPPLIIQPYAENAIWHGLMHKKERGHLEIELSQVDDRLYCTITDDGIGRKRAAELKSKSGQSHKSMGMRITADRIALLQQQRLIHASMQVNDLVLPDGSAGGTEVILKLPIRYD
jgi:LytS/YehU family sensor histidine kinase